LKGLLSELKQDRINNYLVNRGIEWHFQPPLASHRGGIWERMIRSFRKIFTALTFEQTLTDEALMTYVTEVERILNNRPLVPIYDDDTDRFALTPNDLLLLRPVGNIPNVVLGFNRFTRQWKQAKYLAGVFWCRWLKEYVPTLQQRVKWHNPTRNFRVNDVVLVVTESSARAGWPLGRIVEVYPGLDGMIRKAAVKSNGVTLLRDVRKLCLLEGTIETD
jgi:hypothetical protein